jgi:D-alanyl-D-alanine carboxypeptidase
MSAMRDNRRLIGVVMGGDSAGQRDRMMADLMDYGFASAQSMRLSPWTSIRKPASARYSATSFDPGLVIPESTPRLAPPALPPAAPPPVQTVSTDQRVAGPAVPAPAAAAPGGLSIGSWVIQVGSFSDSQGAQLALERASSALPDSMRAAAAATVDEVQMANKSFHRARFTNLSQGQAVDGCKQLEKRKIYCSAIQVTAWNTPGAH